MKWDIIEVLRKYPRRTKELVFMAHWASSEHRDHNNVNKPSLILSDYIIEPRSSLGINLSLYRSYASYVLHSNNEVG